MKNIVSLIFKYLRPLLGISLKKPQNQSQRLMFQDHLVSVICGIGLMAQKGSELSKNRTSLPLDLKRAPAWRWKGGWVGWSISKGCCDGRFFEVGVCPTSSCCWLGNHRDVVVMVCMWVHLVGKPVNTSCETFKRLGRCEQFGRKSQTL